MGFRVAKVTFNLHDNDKKLIEFGKNKVMEIMWAAGAKQVVQESRFAHLVGAARMGSDPSTSVVDKFGRTHDIPNLFVCDGSILPTQGSANPGLTIQALAASTADYLIKQGDAIFYSNRRDLNEPGIRYDLEPALHAVQRKSTHCLTMLRNFLAQRAAPDKPAAEYRTSHDVSMTCCFQAEWPRLLFEWPMRTEARSRQAARHYADGPENPPSCAAALCIPSFQDIGPAGRERTFCATMAFTVEPPTQYSRRGDRKLAQHARRQPRPPRVRKLEAPAVADPGQPAFYPCELRRIHRRHMNDGHLYLALIVNKLAAKRIRKPYDGVFGRAVSGLQGNASHRQSRADLNDPSVVARKHAAQSSQGPMNIAK